MHKQKVKKQQVGGEYGIFVSDNSNSPHQSFSTGIIGRPFIAVGRLCSGEAFTHGTNPFRHYGLKICLLPERSQPSTQLQSDCPSEGHNYRTYMDGELRLIWCKDPRKHSLSLVDVTHSYSRGVKIYRGTIYCNTKM